jgi:hypothetical protein
MSESASVKKKPQLAVENKAKGGRLTKDERQTLREEIERKLQQLHDEEMADLEVFGQVRAPRS